MEFMFPYLSEVALASPNLTSTITRIGRYVIPSLVFSGLAQMRPESVALWEAREADPTVDEVIRNFVSRPLLWIPTVGYIGKVTSLYRSSEPFLLDMNGAPR